MIQQLQPRNQMSNDATLQIPKLIEFPQIVFLRKTGLSGAYIVIQQLQPGGYLRKTIYTSRVLLNHDMDQYRNILRLGADFCHEAGNQRLAESACEGQYKGERTLPQSRSQAQGADKAHAQL